MIKTIDTEVVTQEMVDELSSWESNQTMIEGDGIKAILKAAPEVKDEQD